MITARELTQFDKFLASKKRVDDLGDVIRDSCLEGVPGFVYLDSLYIEELEVGPKPPGAGAIY